MGNALHNLVYAEFKQGRISVIIWFWIQCGKRILGKTSAISLTYYTPSLKLAGNLLHKEYYIGKHFIKYLHVNRGS